MAKRRSMRALMHAHTLTALEHDGVCRVSKWDHWWVYEYNESYYNPITLIWRSLYRAQRIFRGNTCMAICRHFYCFLVTNTFCLPPASSLACRHLTRRNISHTRNDPALHILSPSLQLDFCIIQNIAFWYQEWNFYIYPTTNRSDPPQSVQEMLGARQQFLLWFMDLPVLLSARSESMGCVIDAVECWKLSHGGQQNILPTPESVSTPTCRYAYEWDELNISKQITSHVQDRINPSRLKRSFLSSIKCLSVCNLV